MATPKVATAEADTWMKRLVGTVVEADDSPLVFVVGSGLSRAPDGKGVWNVAEIVQHVCGKYDLQAGDKTGGEAYQHLMGVLKEERGPSHVGQVVRESVLQAYTGADRDLILKMGSNEQVKRCRALDQDGKSDWLLPPGVQALAKLLQQFVSVGHDAFPLVITTNFDGLIEVALQRCGLVADPYGVIDDEFPRPPRTPKVVQVWHVHGYWTGSTLHSEEELTERRRKLEDALRSRFDGARVFVLAYGGWDDVVFDALSAATRSHPEMSPPDVAWGFFQAAPDVAAGNPHVLQRFSNMQSKVNVQYFAGINAHTHLVQAAQEVARRLAPPPSQLPPAAPDGPHRCRQRCARS